MHFIQVIYKDNARFTENVVRYISGVGSELNIVGFENVLVKIR